MYEGHPDEQDITCADILGKRQFAIESCVGKPLSEFGNTRELVSALYNAVQVHKEYFRAGMLDWNLGDCRLMTMDNKSQGIVLDLDYGKFPENYHRDSYVRTFPLNLASYRLYDSAIGRTEGIYSFLAVDILNRKGELVEPTVQHDLEALYWLLIWMVLRHTQHTHRHGMNAYRKLFRTTGNESADRARKEAWISGSGQFSVRDNQPLTQLLASFAELVKDNREVRGEDQECPLTHESVLALLESALQMEGWPTNDSALPFGRPKGTSHA